MNKIKLMEALLLASQNALDKEKRSVKELLDSLKDKPLSECIDKLKWSERDSGFTNGLLEALQIVSRMDE